MQGILYEEPSALLFVLVTGVMGGLAAFQTGRAVAQTWRPASVLLPYMLLLGVAVRFLHFALFEGTMLAPHYYLVDTAILLVAAFLGWRVRRARQMATQYSWIYERAGPFGWRLKTA